MRRISELMGGAKNLAEIEPPGRSFEKWRLFINECIRFGAIVVEADEHGAPVRYSGVLANALAKRVGWLADAASGEIPYADAEKAFEAAVDQSRALEHKNSRAFEGRRASSIREQTDDRRKKRGRRPEPAEWREELDAFADEAGL